MVPNIPKQNLLTYARYYVSLPNIPCIVLILFTYRTAVYLPYCCVILYNNLVNQLLQVRYSTCRQILQYDLTLNIITVRQLD